MRTIEAMIEDPRFRYNYDFGLLNPIQVDKYRTYGSKGMYESKDGPTFFIPTKDYKGFVIPDNRWPNGAGGKGVREAGGVLLRMKRGEGLQGSAGKHSSETIQQECPDDIFDYVADNRDWSHDELKEYMDFIVEDMTL